MTVRHDFACFSPESGFISKNVFELNTQKTQSKVAGAVREPPLPGTLPAAMAGAVSVCCL